MTEVALGVYGRRFGFVRAEAACTGSLGLAAIASGFDPSWNTVALLPAEGALLVFALVLASASLRAFMLR